MSFSLAVIIAFWVLTGVGVGFFYRKARNRYLKQLRQFELEFREYEDGLEVGFKEPPSQMIDLQVKKDRENLIRL